MESSIKSQRPNWSMTIWSSMLSVLGQRGISQTGYMPRGILLCPMDDLVITEQLEHTSLPSLQKWCQHAIQKSSSNALNGKHLDKPYSSSICLIRLYVYIYIIYIYYNIYYNIYICVKSPFHTFAQLLLSDETTQEK